MRYARLRLRFARYDKGAGASLGRYDGSGVLVMRYAPRASLGRYDKGGASLGRYDGRDGGLLGMTAGGKSRRCLAKCGIMQKKIKRRLGNRRFCDYRENNFAR